MGLLVVPRMVRGRSSQFKGFFGVAARSLRDPGPASLCGPYGRLRGQPRGPAPGGAAPPGGGPPGIGVSALGIAAVIKGFLH